MGTFCDLGNGTVRDTATGLEWEKKDTTVGSGVNAADLHDVDNPYSWAGCCGTCTGSNFCQPNAAAAATCVAHANGGTTGCSVCASGTCNVDPFGFGAATTVWDWLNAVNASGFAGHNDWRLPSENGCNSCYTDAPSYKCPCASSELETILLASYPCGTSPCVASIFGPTASSYYWSASSRTSIPDTTWNVYFLDGKVLNVVKDLNSYVRAVR